MKQFIYLYLVFIFLFLNLKFSDQISTQEYLTLAHEQFIKFLEFKGRVIDKVTQEYMKSDIFIIRWLREKDFNVEEAEKLLMNHLEWRKKNSIDTVLDERWDDFDEEYRLYLEGCDRDGHPIVALQFKHWDIRRAIISGKGPRLMRFIDKLFEDALDIQRMMLKDGQNTTQLTFVLDSGGISATQHLCPRCIPIYLYLLFTLTQNYPGVVHKAYAINTPSIAVVVWDIYKHLVPKQYFDLINIYGTDKNEWIQALMEDIDRDQLSTAFGGTNFEGVDVHELRQSGKLYRCFENNNLFQQILGRDR